jgi:hypothetical protein
MRKEHREDVKTMDASMQRMDANHRADVKTMDASMQRMDANHRADIKNMDDKWAKLFGLFVEKLKG